MADNKAEEVFFHILDDDLSVSVGELIEHLSNFRPETRIHWFARIPGRKLQIIGHPSMLNRLYVAEEAHPEDRSKDLRL